MRILLKTESSDPDFNADCECAVLDVTPELLQRVKARVKIARHAAKADGNLWELYFWGGAPTFHGYDLIEACAEAATESDDSGQNGLKPPLSTSRRRGKLATATRTSLTDATRANVRTRGRDLADHRSHCTASMRCAADKAPRLSSYALLAN